MRILLSNDDGVHARGLHVLQNELKKIGDVWVVAPMEEKSTTGHSLTLHKPLRVTQVGPRFFGVSGSPADCVYVGIREVLKNKFPDIVISGINRGANMGQDVYYSGTVSAAREACIMGIRAIAVSLAIDFYRPRKEEQLHYQTAAKLCTKLIRELNGTQLPKYTLLNLNSPDLPYSKVKGFKVVNQGFRHYSGTVLKRRDHRGRDYFWVGGQYKGFKAEPETDCYVVDRGYASVTPLQLDSTNTGFMPSLKRACEDE